MTHLHERIAPRVDAWRADGYPCDDYPAIAEIFEWARDPETAALRFLRLPQLRALETKVSRKKGRILVEIEDFISPTILERLEQQAGILKPTIDDWRAMVDCIMIDLAYNGQVFNITVSDVPEKKSDLVTGKYELPAPQGKFIVAVKIVDMLGEELLISREV